MLRKKSISLALSSPTKRNPTTIINVIIGSLTIKRTPDGGHIQIGIADSKNNHVAWIGIEVTFLPKKYSGNGLVGQAKSDRRRLWRQLAG